MEDKIPKRNKSDSQKLVNLIILLADSEKEDLKPSEFIEHTCDNTPGHSTSGKYVNEISRFDSGMPEEWIIFLDLVFRMECHYWSTHVQMHEKGTER